MWGLLEPVFRAGDTYAIPMDITQREAISYWRSASHRVYVAEEDEIIGSYYLKTNQQGGGDHVCNAAFITSPAARGRGVARTMLQHAIDTAREAGFRAMQFNFVVETNAGAIRLWRSEGFEVVGRLPKAFRHPERGDVDALVMFRLL